MNTPINYATYSNLTLASAKNLLSKASGRKHPNCKDTERKDSFQVFRLTKMTEGIALHFIALQGRIKNILYLLSPREGSNKTMKIKKV